MTQTKALALVGVGNIGQHFATRLLRAGYRVTVFDLNQAALDRLAGEGARIAKTVEDLARTHDTILLSLPTPAIVKGVVDQIAAAHGGDGPKLVVDLSTTGPDATRSLHDTLSARGISLIGAPVSGGTANAEQGKLAIMAAGPRSVYDAILPILEVIGHKIFYIGEDPSLGQTIKIINNTLYATSLIASSEALVYGKKAGLDPQVMLDVINVSSGRSFATMERIPQCALDGSFPMRFTTALLHKDVKMCIDDAERIGAPMQVNPVARQFLAFAMTQGLGERDNMEVIRPIEGWAGVELRAANSASAPSKS